MPTIYDVSPNDLILKVAEELKGMPEMKPPEWADYVKTGMHKERPPIDEDWWYIRAAAVLRSVAKLGPVGVSKLRTKYGGRKNRGHKPDKFYRGSGNILRKVLQQLEKAGLLEYKKDGVRKGRIITGKGRSLLDKKAGLLTKGKPKAHKKPEAKPEPKVEKKEEPKAEVKKEEKPEPKKTEKPKEEPKAKE